MRVRWNNPRDWLLTHVPTVSTDEAREDVSLDLDTILLLELNLLIASKGPYYADVSIRGGGHQ